MSHAATVAALRRVLSHGAPLTGEERHAGFALMCALADELAADPELSDRLERRCVAVRRGD